MNSLNFNLSDYLHQGQDLVNGHLQRILGKSNPELELTMAMEHSLMAGGKRLRPLLCLAAAEAAGGNVNLAMPAACAIEMIHTYSLIHDDLPAMDDDDLRRGKPTCHKKFSEATAILAGDGLLTHAFYILANPKHYFKSHPDKGALYDIIALISHASGIDGMIEGQMMDMLFQGEPLGDTSHSSGKVGDKDLMGRLTKMHSLKTGKMIRVSLEAGAVSVGAKASMIQHLLTYGENLGLAFQVTDDILNVEGDPAVMGKAAGSDALNDKMTFPALLGLEGSKRYAQEKIASAIDALETFGKKALPLEAIARYVLNRKK